MGTRKGLRTVFYAGKKSDGSYVCFGHVYPAGSKSERTPTSEMYDYRMVVGPFKTKRAAVLWAKVPHTITQDQAEHAARMQAALDRADRAVTKHRKTKGFPD